jgi:hypothetical protein
MKRSALTLVAVTLLAAGGVSLHSQAQTQNQPPSPARSRSDEMCDRWNDIGNKLIAMAQDFPEDKYDFKVKKDQRTFALNLLHAAALRNQGGNRNHWIEFELAGSKSNRWH